LAGIPDSGLVYAKLAVKYATEPDYSSSLIYPLGTLAECYITLKQYDTAIPLLRHSLQLSMLSNDRFALSWGTYDFAWIYYEKNIQDSVRYYAQQTIRHATPIAYQDLLYQAYNYLYLSYEKSGTTDSAYKYFKLYTLTKDSLFNSKKTKQITAINFKEQLRQRELEQEKVQLQNKIRTYALLAGIGTFLTIGLILYRNNRLKQKANIVLQEQKAKIECTLKELKATQSQLIQSEKMASLGELTAGIAHEIQNPLNFVNNFSEVSKELLDEMREAIDKGDSVEVKEIMNDVIQNLEKINHHGKRADGIVKGMLQHSQSSSGKKEPTDINKLADEYLRLAYHGLRAKDKSFNATLKTDFDKTIGNINIIPQDIGRVILNLITNAFYATSEKQKAESLKPGHNKYEPLVIIQTKKTDSKIAIRVTDNGNGMPQKVLDKIFQPFFTTKPTGQGTGLGLSLSYDIIKAHGGELKVETKEGEGSTFIIQLPII
jgi:signal transduction histidine kinase